MKTFKTISIAVLSLMMAACSSDMQEAAPDLALKSGKGIPFSATISQGAVTRTELTENMTDKTLESQWATGDEVAMVYDVGGNTKVTKAIVTSLTDKSATITATLEEGVTNGTEVSLYYPYAAIDNKGKVKTDLFENQTGMLADIAANQDLHKGQGEFSITTDNASLKKNVSMTKQAAIWKLSLSDGTNKLAVDCFEIRDKSGQPMITVQPPSSTPTSELYVAMMPTALETLHFVGKNGDDEYYYTKYDLTLNAGTYYQSSMTLADMLHTPLTLEAVGDGTITFKNAASGVVRYQINDGDKQEIENGETGNINVLAGDVVTFYADNPSYYDSNSKISNIACSNQCYLYGNIMSLISSTNFATVTALPGNHTFEQLFKDNTKILNHDTKDLLLPATTLKDQCYRYMFDGCTGLTVAPALPATTLASKCYLGMFFKCTGLTTVPSLPATKLADGCYESLFDGCKGLTALPEDLLPATKLEEGCYKYMFCDCDGLTALPEKLLPATTLAESCYSLMFYSCDGLETLPAKLLPATTLAKECYRAMFFICSNLKIAPDLPAEVLVEQCYQEMFQYCTRLTSVTCLATDITATKCLSYWLDAAGESGSRTLHVKSGQEGKNWETYGTWPIVGDK